MNKRVNTFKEWLVAAFIAETEVCGLVSAYVKIPNISVIVMGIILLAIMITDRHCFHIDHFCFTVYIIIFLLMITSMIINGESNTLDYFLHFIAFGFTGLCLISITVDLSKVIPKIIIIYSIVIVNYFVNERTAFLSSTNYWLNQMGVAYGFVTGVLASFAYIYAYRRFFSENHIAIRYLAFIVFFTCIYIILFDCGTRGAIISVLLGCGLILLFSSNGSRKMIIITIGLIVTLLIIENSDALFGWIAEQYSGSNIIAMRKLAQFITSNKIDNGRNYLYDGAVDCFLASPIIGNGVGHFENLYAGRYVHEVFLEILCEFGIIGFAPMCFLLIRYLIKLFLSEYNVNKLFSVFLVGNSFLILLYSNSYWLLPTFWYFLFHMIIYCRKDREYND